MFMSKRILPASDDFEVGCPVGDISTLDFLEVPENFKPKNELTFKGIKYVLFVNIDSGKQYLIDKKFVDLKGIDYPEIELFENIIDNHLSKQYVIDLQKNPLDFSFPARVVLKDVRLSVDFGQEIFELVELVQLNCFDILVDPPVLDSSFEDVQGRKYTIGDLTRMFESREISAEACSVLLLEYLRCESWQDYIKIVTALNKEKSDFAVSTDLEWLGIVDLDFPPSLNGNFYLITRLAKLVRIYIESKKAKKDKRRVLVNPFDADMYGYRESMNTPNTRLSVTKIEPSRHNNNIYDHLCHDSIALANGDELDVAVVDGAGGHAGAYFMSIALSQYFAEGKSMLDPHEWADFYKKKCDEWGVLNIQSLGCPPMAVYARANVDLNQNMVDLESLGDAYAVHFDANYNLVQGLGGEFADYDIYSKPRFVDPLNKSNFKATAERYFENDNVPAGSVLHGRVKGSIALSRQPYKKGDFILVMTDWVDKVFNAERVKNILAPLYKSTSLHINRTDIDRLDNLEGIKPTYYVNNRLSGFSNRNQNIYLHMIALNPFIFLVKELHRLGVVVDPNKLYLFLKENMQSCLDDASLALIFPQK